jgi:hypothetical protein
LPAQSFADGKTLTETGLPRITTDRRWMPMNFIVLWTRGKPNWIQTAKPVAPDSTSDTPAIARQLLLKYQPLFDEHFSSAGRDHWQKLRDQVLAADLKEPLK